MKNMRLRSKLLSAFVMLGLLALIAGTIAIYGLNSLQNHVESLNTFMVNTNYSSRLLANVHEQRVYYRDALLDVDNPEKLLRDLEAMEELKVELDTLVDYLDEHMILEENRDRLHSFMQVYYNDYAPQRDALLDATRRGNTDEIMDTIGKITDSVHIMLKEVDELNLHAMMASNSVSKTAIDKAWYVTVLITVTGFVIIISAVFLGFRISRMIAQPTNHLLQAAKKLSAGDIDADVNVGIHDEIGDLAEAFSEMIDSIKVQSSMLQAVADGDYSISVPVRSGKDVINLAINRLAQKGSDTMGELRTASTQVASASTQIAQSAQDLASGTTQQATSAQQFSIALASVEEKTRENAKDSQAAQEITDTAGKLMRDSVSSMNLVQKSMEEIDNSIRMMSNVIKVIDDIAFQTSILALNASVEAARAGQHGKGFAVVAGEVRRLAMKSAGAARETAGIIEAGVDKIREGSTHVENANEQITEAWGHISQAMEMVHNVTEATEAQAESLSQMNAGIDQITKVIQENSAMSQQAAAAAQMMSAQAALLDEIVKQFKLRENQEDNPDSADEDDSMYGGNVFPLYKKGLSLAHGNTR